MRDIYGLREKKNNKGKENVKALAVASEPSIFWTGEDAEEIISTIKIFSIPLYFIIKKYVFMNIHIFNNQLRTKMKDDNYLEW